MAIAIASSTIQNYIPGTDIGTDTQFTITKPTGVTSGELLLLYLQGARTSRTVNLPTGFTSIPLDVADTQVEKLAYRYADSTDEAASNYTFTVTGDDRARARWAMLRLTGAQSSGTPATDHDGFSFIANSTSISQAIDVQTQSGGLLLTIITGAEVGADNASGFSSLSLTGATVSMTEQWDSEGNPSSGTGTYGALYTGIPTADGDITNISFTYNDDTGDNDSIRVNVIFLRAQQDASASLTLTTNSNTNYAATVSAGAHQTLSLTTTTNTKLDPTAVAYNPTKWTTTTKS